MKKLLALIFIAKFAIFSCWASEGYDDLAKLVKSGVSEDVIVAYINSSTTNYSLTPEEILHLKDMGASGNVLTAAIQKKKPANDSAAQQSRAAGVPSKEAAKTVYPGAPSFPADTNIVYEYVPPSGKWVLINDYWYWQYPTGVIVDLGWQPYYFYNYRWYPHYRHWGRRGW